MVIDGLLILGICVIGGVLVVGGLCEKNMPASLAAKAEGMGVTDAPKHVFKSEQKSNTYYIRTTLVAT